MPKSSSLPPLIEDYFSNNVTIAVHSSCVLSASEDLTEWKISPRIQLLADNLKNKLVPLMVVAEKVVTKESGNCVVISFDEKTETCVTMDYFFSLLKPISGLIRTRFYEDDSSLLSLVSNDLASNNLKNLHLIIPLCELGERLKEKGVQVHWAYLHGTLSITQKAEINRRLNATLLPQKFRLYVDVCALIDLTRSIFSYKEPLKKLCFSQPLEVYILQVVNNVLFQGKDVEIKLLCPNKIISKEIPLQWLTNKFIERQCGRGGKKVRASFSEMTPDSFNECTSDDDCFGLALLTLESIQAFKFTDKNRFTLAEVRIGGTVPCVLIKHIRDRLPNKQAERVQLNQQQKEEDSYVVVGGSRENKQRKKQVSKVVGERQAPATASEEENKDVPGNLVGAELRFFTPKGVGNIIDVFSSVLPSDGEATHGTGGTLIFTAT